MPTLIRALAVLALIAPSWTLAASGPALLSVVGGNQPASGILLTAVSTAVSPDGAYLYLATAGDDSIVIYSRAADTGYLTRIGVVRDGVGGVDGLDGVQRVRLSPDGASLYAAGRADHALAVFSRDVTTGALTFVEVHRDGVAGVDGLRDAEGIAISPDGTSVYATSAFDDAIAIFGRDTSTGALTWLGMVVQHVGGVAGLDNAIDVAVSPDGANVYAVGSEDEKVSIFARDGGTGALTFLDWVFVDSPRRVSISPDGDHVYVTADFPTLRAFVRDPGTGLLTAGPVVPGVPSGSILFGDSTDVAVSPDGQHVAVAAEGGIAAFARDAGSGALTLLGKMQDGVEDVGFDCPRGFSWSPGNEHFYVGGSCSNSLAQFRLLAVDCAASPMVACAAPVASGKASLAVKDFADPAKAKSDSLTWKWVQGAATDVADFGNPAGSDNDYALCIYRGAYPVLERIAPAGAQCKGKPCWKASGVTGFKYGDAEGTPDGISKITLKAGVAGKATLMVKGKGASLLSATSTLVPFATPVTVQLQTAGGTCFGAVYSTPQVNAGEQFKAKAD